MSAGLVKLYVVRAAPNAEDATLEPAWPVACAASPDS